MQHPTRRRVILLKEHQRAGTPSVSNFEFAEQELPALKENQLLVQVLYLSVDPYMRGRMTGIKTYADPFEIGKPLYGGGIVRVLASQSPQFQAGEFLINWAQEWSDFAVLSVNPALSKILSSSPEDLPAFLSGAGLTGLTAHIGLFETGKLKEKEVLVVSGAAGATGSFVGQLAKVEKNAYVVGIAGSEEKCAFLKKELGFDECLNYNDPEFAKKLEAATPNGVDVYFDNVGGEISDAVHKRMNTFGRIAICGSISTYNADKPPTGPRIEGPAIVKRLTFAGFLVRDHAQQWPELQKKLFQLIKEGKLKNQLTIENGLENVPKAFLSLFTGGNIGKMLVKISN